MHFIDGKVVTKLKHHFRTIQIALNFKVIGRYS